jgi:hypothetical protein
VYRGRAGAGVCQARQATQVTLSLALDFKAISASKYFGRLSSFDAFSDGDARYSPAIFFDLRKSRRADPA